MFAKDFKESLFARIVVVIITASFVLTSGPVGYCSRAYAADNLKPQAVRQRTNTDGGTALGALMQDFGKGNLDGGVRVFQPIDVLSTLVTNLIGKETRGYNIVHAALDGANGALHSHSEARRDLEDRVDNLLGNILNLVTSKASEQAIRASWSQSFSDIGLNEKQITESLIHLSKLLKDPSKREDIKNTLTNKVVRHQIEADIEFSKEYYKKNHVYPFRQTVLCIGEKYFDESNPKKSLGEIESQIREILDGFALEDLKIIGLRIAYEPRDIIGKGVIPQVTLDRIDSTIFFMKSITFEVLGEELEVDYGASVDKDNVRQIVLGGANGLLIGTKSKAPVDLEPIIDICIVIAKQTGKIINVGINWKAETETTGLKPVQDFVEMLKTKDLSRVKISISTNRVNAVRAEVDKLEAYLRQTTPEAEALVRLLQKNLGNPKARAQILQQIAGLGLDININTFLDLFLIKEKGRIDLEQLAALKSRLIKRESPAVAKKRVAIFGSNNLAFLTARELVTNYNEDLELVAMVGKPIEEIYPFIIRDTHQGPFRGRKVKAGDFLYLGKQKEAIRVFSEKSFLNVPEQMPWKALGIDIVMLDEDMFNKIGNEGVAKLRAQGVQVVITKAVGEDSITYFAGLADEAEVQREMNIAAAASEDSAVTHGLAALKTLGNIKVIDTTVIEASGTQAPSTYRIKGAYQTVHELRKDRFKEIPKRLGIYAPMTVSSSFKTQISRGKAVIINACIDGTLTKEQVVKAFREYLKDKDVLATPEEGYMITSNTILGEKRIFFAENDVYVSPYRGGTVAKIILILDEENSQVDTVLKAISGKSSFVAEVPQVVLAKEEFEKSEYLAKLAQQVEATKKAKEEKKAEEAAKIVKTIEDAKKATRELVGAAEKISTADERFSNVHLLFSQEKGWNKDLRVLRNKGKVVGLFYFEDDKLYATSVLTPLTVEQTQQTQAEYYIALRDIALSVSSLNMPVEIVDFYRPKENLIARSEVFAKNPKETIIKTFEQKIKGKWVVLSAPNMRINLDEFQGKIVIAINGAGGRMGGLITRLAAEKRNTRIIFLGGPGAGELVDYLNAGDPVHGRYKKVKYINDDLIALNGKEAIILSSRASQAFRDPANYPWAALMIAGISVDVAEDTTGNFVKDEELSKHLEAGALRAGVSAPGKGKKLDKQTFVMNINQGHFDPSKHFIFSSASCTTGCYALVARGLELAIAIKNGFLDMIKFEPVDMKTKIAMAGDALKNLKPIIGNMETIHALTGEESIADRASAAKEATRFRDAMQLISLTTTGAARAIGLVDERLKSDGLAIRIPTDDISIVAANFILEGTYSWDDILKGYQALMKVARGTILKDVPNSAQIKIIEAFKMMMAIVSPDKIQVENFVNDKGEPMTFVRAFGWYDNEYYYAREVVDFIDQVIRKKETQPRLKVEEDGRIVLEARKEKLAFLTMDDVELSGKKTITRVDTNSPAENGKLILSKGIPQKVIGSSVSIKEASERGAKVVVITHQGRKGDPDYVDNLEEMARLLSELAGKEIKYVDDFGAALDEALAAMKSGDIVMVPNIRREISETEELSPRVHGQSPVIRKLRDWADLFINDAFPAAHRAHASITGFYDMPNIAGRLMEKEIKGVSQAMALDKKPALDLLAGEKIDDYIGMMGKSLEQKLFDEQLTGGLLCQVCLMAQEYKLGKPTEDSLRQKFKDYKSKKIEGKGFDVLLQEVKGIMEKHPGKIIVPVDLAYIDANGQRQEIIIEEKHKTEPISDEFLFGDIGTKTAEMYASKIMNAKAIYGKGPLGDYKKKQFQKGSEIVYSAVKESGAYLLKSGGDLGEMLKQLGIEAQDGYDSLGGGVVIKAYEKGLENLPGIRLSLTRTANRILPKARDLKVTPQALVGYDISENSIFKAKAGRAFTAYASKMWDYFQTHQVDITPRALIISESYFRLSGARNALQKIAELNKEEMIIGVFGPKADRIGVLIGEDNVITGETLDEVMESLSKEGVLSNEMVLLTDTQVTGVKIKQVVAPKGIPATLAIAKASKELLNTDEMNKVFAEFYQEVKNKNVISSDIDVELEQKLLEALKEGGTFEFSNAMTVTLQISEEIKQAELIATEFLDRV